MREEKRGENTNLVSMARRANGKRVESTDPVEQRMVNHARQPFFGRWIDATLQRQLRVEISGQPQPSTLNSLPLVQVIAMTHEVDRQTSFDPAT